MLDIVSTFYWMQFFGFTGQIFSREQPLEDPELLRKMRSCVEEQLQELHDLRKTLAHCSAQLAIQIATEEFIPQTDSDWRGCIERAQALGEQLKVGKFYLSTFDTLTDRLNKIRKAVEYFDFYSKQTQRVPRLIRSLESYGRLSLSPAHSDFLFKDQHLTELVAHLHQALKNTFSQKLFGEVIDLWKEIRIHSDQTESAGCYRLIRLLRTCEELCCVLETLKTELKNKNGLWEFGPDMFFKTIFLLRQRGILLNNPLFFKRLIQAWSRLCHHNDPTDIGYLIATATQNIPNFHSVLCVLERLAPEHLHPLLGRTQSLCVLEKLSERSFFMLARLLRQLPELTLKNFKESLEKIYFLEKKHSNEASKVWIQSHFLLFLSLNVEFLFLQSTAHKMLLAQALVDFPNSYRPCLGSLLGFLLPQERLLFLNTHQEKIRHMPEAGAAFEILSSDEKLHFESNCYQFVWLFLLHAQAKNCILRSPSYQYEELIRSAYGQQLIQIGALPKPRASETLTHETSWSASNSSLLREILTARNPGQLSQAHHDFWALVLTSPQKLEILKTLINFSFKNLMTRACFLWIPAQGAKKGKPNLFRTLASCHKLSPWLTDPQSPLRYLLKMLRRTEHLVLRKTELIRLLCEPNSLSFWRFHFLKKERYKKLYQAIEAQLRIQPLCAFSLLEFLGRQNSTELDPNGTSFVQHAVRTALKLGLYEEYWEILCHLSEHERVCISDFWQALAQNPGLLESLKNPENSTSFIFLTHRNLKASNQLQQLIPSHWRSHSVIKALRKELEENAAPRRTEVGSALVFQNEFCAPRLLKKQSKTTVSNES